MKDFIYTMLISGLEISALDNADFIELPDVMTQETMPVSKHNVPQQHDLSKWLYLRDVKLHDLNADVDLLIGTDAPRVIEP